MLNDSRKDIWRNYTFPKRQVDEDKQEKEVLGLINTWQLDSQFYLR